MPRCIIQIILSPEKLFVEYIDDGEVGYPPIIHVILTKSHNNNNNFHDSYDMGGIAKTSVHQIKRFNPKTEKYEQFSKTDQLGERKS
ncbi:pathogenicity island protein [Staphylococcus aureus]|uniref:pathogenicity island protein n=1 Tax=Staphylococcus aureus TaxID=1280 RepID=UPI0004531394|nr:hypothetical protein V145_02693 [Staphylococcus aureus ZTA11/00189-8HSA]SHC91490.1 pathogenicity island protein [Staphylococcus aureus]